MDLTTISLLLLGFAFLAFQAGRGKAIKAVGGPHLASRLQSRPQYYGYFTVIRCLAPALALVLLWVAVEDQVIIALAMKGIDAGWPELPVGELDLLINSIRNLADGNVVAGAVTDAMRLAAERVTGYAILSRRLLAIAALLTAFFAAALAFRRITPEFQARGRVERSLTWLLIGASSVALFTTVGIVLSVVFEAARFFREVSVTEFLFGLNWSPQTAIRADQIGSSGSFGAVPLFTGTLLITLIAMLVAIPIGLMTATYLGEYSSRRVRETAKPLLEILAGIPTVVYGFFAAVTVAPMVRNAGDTLGLAVSSESALAAGLVMGIMIIPLISSLSDDAIRAVPTATREAALALGSTRSEMMARVVMPAALPGIVGGVLLAVSRAIGETMIVVMAAGLAANLTFNPFEAVTTVTVQIATLLVGDQEFDSAKTLAAFALGLVLFVVTLCLNVLGLRIVRRYQEQYE